MTLNEPFDIPNVEPRRRYDDPPLLPTNAQGRVIIPAGQQVEPWTDEEIAALLGIDPETGAIDPDVLELAEADLLISGDDDLIDLFNAGNENGPG